MTAAAVFVAEPLPPASGPCGQWSGQDEADEGCRKSVFPRRLSLQEMRLKKVDRIPDRPFEFWTGIDVEMSHGIGFDDDSFTQDSFHSYVNVRHQVVFFGDLR